MEKILFVVLLFVYAQATIVITNPLNTDFTNNTIDYFYANFGQVPYGKTLSFDLVIFKHSLCNDSSLQKLKKPTYLVVKPSYHQTCSFTKRCQIAQKLGAKGVIISDVQADYQKDGKAIEADDGNGKRVHITCLFITTKSFEILSKLSKIQITTKFAIPQAKVSIVTLFISSAKRSSYVFLRQLRQQYKYLKGDIIIQPIYHTIECPQCGSQNCLFDSYCTYDYQTYEPNVGQKIILEELYQYAIFTQKGIDKWLEYMNLFDQYCDGDWNSLQDCKKEIWLKMPMPNVTIANPMDQTLRSWRIKQVHLGFDNFPQVAINSLIYRGNFQIEDIVQAICSSLTKPTEYCVSKFEDSGTNAKENSSLSVERVIFSIFLSLCMIGSCCLCCYRKFVNKQLTKDMTNKVGQIVANYATKVSEGSKKKNVELVQELNASGQ